jgi:zinc and cadmium transporter
MHLLPEAFESAAGSHDLFAVFLAGVVFFFVLDKVELYHHGHEHGHDHAHHEHAHAPARADAAAPPMGGGWSVLAGDSVHAFGDGILIASAFMADWKLGLVTSLAVLAHEVPHHMGDLVVLRGTVGSRRAAVVKVSLAGTVTALGGVVGYAMVSQLDDYLPFFLVVASSSFVYVALADLIPQLQKRLNLTDTLAQLVWLLVGVALVTTVSGLAHGG